MQRLQIAGLLLMAWVAMTAEVVAQPERGISKATGKERKIPDGFELQKLELGGEILKPIGWKYEARKLGKTLACKMWEPMPNDAPGFDTSFTIDIVTNTVDAGLTPSNYASSYMDALKKKGTVVKAYKPRTTNGMVQSSIVMDQKLTITGSEKKYRIRTVLFADDKNELLFVLTFGTLASEWDTHEPTFRTMTKNLKLVDLSSLKNSNESTKTPSDGSPNSEQ